MRSLRFSLNIANILCRARGIVKGSDLRFSDTNCQNRGRSTYLTWDRAVLMKLEVSIANTSAHNSAVSNKVTIERISSGGEENGPVRSIDLERSSRRAASSAPLAHDEYTSRSSPVLGICKSVGSRFFTNSIRLAAVKPSLGK